MNNIRWQPIIISCLLVSVAQLGIGLVLPALPWIAKDFQITQSDAQILTSLFILGIGPSQLLYGPLSDAIGRKPVILIGLGMILIGLCFTVFFANSFAALALGRILQGVGSGSVAVLSRATLRDSYSNDNLIIAINWLSIAAAFTPLGAPIVGGFLNYHFGWLSVFIFLLSYVLLIFAIISLFFNESLEAKHRFEMPVIIKSYRALTHDRYFLFFASIGWVNYSMLIIGISLMPFIMQNQIGMTSDTYAIWWLIPASGLLLGAIICGRLRSKIGLEKTMRFSTYMQAFGGVWLIVMPLHPLVAMFGMLCLTTANGISYPCSQSSMLAPYKSNSGTVAAFSGTCQMICASLSSLILMHFGMKYIWHYGIILILAALLGQFFIKKAFIENNKITKKKLL